MKPYTIGPDVPGDAISPDAVIHPGCRLHGASLRIGPGCEIGLEAPATLIDCQLGAQVKFAGGFAEKAVFLDRASVGSAAHIRPGTLMEEEASVAHCVGLKQTILFPFVTLGSLINFCDCLMAGGTSRRNHSEVGSGFVHFNFTPQGDKATPSLIGDVPRGVLLDQPPVFLGGQGGLVGPVRIAYGTVLAAGSVHRRDVAEPNRLIMPAGTAENIDRPYAMRQYRNVRRRIQNNALYLGNLVALRTWYAEVRRHFLPAVLHQGAIGVLDSGLAERRKQLDRWGDKLQQSAEQLAAVDGPRHWIREQQAFANAWKQIAEQMEETMQNSRFEWEGTVPAGEDYLSFIKGLSNSEREKIQTGLQLVVDNMARPILEAVG